jgi:hypothetical protein
MLVHSITSYACEVWVDFKKIEAIEVVYLLGVRKTTSTFVVLAKFGKFPFEHFAWGQALLYYNRVSTITKDFILGKAWEAQLTMFIAGKKCWARSMKKLLFKNQHQEVVGSLLPIQLSLKTTPLGFSHTMLSVKKVKHSMWLAFIEKKFANREIETSM